MLVRFSALQRAEIAEIEASQHLLLFYLYGFSALQRAEIAEIRGASLTLSVSSMVSVLFNEPKLLKSQYLDLVPRKPREFQCSSTSRNC